MTLPKHLFSLDIVRGIAAVAVVFWHWQHFFFKQSALPIEFDRAQQPLYSWFSLLYDHGHLAVPFFFQLSGFVFFWLYLDQVSRGDCSAYKFGVLRFARLYPLHFATLLAVLALQALHAWIIGGYFVYPFNDSYHFLLQLLFASHWGLEKGYSFNAPIWSVSIEIGLYCAFYLFCIAKIHRVAKLTAAILGAYFLMKLGVGERWASPALAFYIGGLTYELTRSYLNHRTQFTDALVVFAAMIAWAGVFTSGRMEYWLLTRGGINPLFLYSLTIASLVIAETRFPDIAKRGAWIGNLTYSSYLLHFPLQLIFVLCFFMLGYDDFAFRSVPVLLAFLSLLMVLSLITYQWFERPVQSALRSRLLPKTMGEPSDAPNSPVDR